MAVFVVNYDLRNDREYEPLYEALRSYDHAHPLESVWVLNAAATSSELRKHLSQFLDEDDGLLVLGLNGDGAGQGISNADTAWLTRNLI